MAVELADLIDSLKREVNPPGTDLYPNATDDDWLGHLADAFWEARIMGFQPLIGFTVDPDAFTVDPITVGQPDLTRDFQQLIVLYAGYRITLTQFQNLNARFHAKAGPVEIEVEKSANTLKAVLDAIKQRIDIVLTRLSDVGGTSVEILDAIIENTYTIATRGQWWVR